MMNESLTKHEENALVFGNAAFLEHEQVVYCQDKATGLKAIIGIHDTTLGPALGGTRMWNYASETEALRDVLRLSRGMTYKASISGLNLGGGKAVILGDSRKHKTPEMMRKFGEFVNRLSGKYITAEDVGISTSDMEMVKQATDHVTGIPEHMGGSGDPSPVTAYGVFHGMRAAAKYRWGTDDLSGKKVLVQGVGHVGETLVKYLTDAGALVSINDIHDDTLARVAAEFGARVVKGDIYDQDMDIYAPCALGATLNDHTIQRLRCEIVAGAANNQLHDEVIHGEMLASKDILYAPDFLINAGGLMNVYSELVKMPREEVFAKAEGIYDTTLRIFKRAELEGITTHQAALLTAKERIVNHKAQLA
jgi:leucine dehydrogenase